MPRMEARSCAVPAMATLLAAARASVQLCVRAHAARRLHFSASSDGLLH
jgi:hypothetical protein